MLVIRWDNEAPRRTQLCIGLCCNADCARANNTCFLGSGVAATISFVIIWDTRHKSKRRRASGRFSCECSQDCSISRDASIPSWRGPASTLSFRILKTVFCSHHIKKLGVSRGLGGCFAGVFLGLFAFQRLILEHVTM